MARPRAIRDVLARLQTDLAAMRPWFRAILTARVGPAGRLP
ncbi:MAG TPA: hypothetical protein VMT17_18470 [Anaeromyxobacteraceae bacterium]|nr:hypothetical protein [Anaeromyxobacteraceae bacterium]